MNLWAQMLAELPATGQRVIARAQRISLPRRCDAATRHLRLRQALCHAATVRAVYALLDSPAQAALQYLRAQPGGINPDALALRYGALRAWRDLAADPRPRTISEQLVLLGWLLPRPAAPRHPPRYLVPPEVRRWLPEPLPARSAPAQPLAPPSPHLPALRATTTLLLAAADQPLPITQASTLRRATLRQITPRLTLIDPPAGAALLDWLLPLLVALDLLSCHAGHTTITLAGQRFLALPPAQQHAQLRDAWIRSPVPDAWLLRLLVDPRGIDWPLLRRRLCSWAGAIPADDTRDAATRYTQLARSFGPLADAQTHGFRAVDRAPWQLRRAAAVLDAALHGPLSWLGLLGADAMPPDPSPPDPLAATSSASAQPHRMRNPPRPPECRGRRPSRWCWPDTPAQEPAAVSAPADADTLCGAQSSAPVPQADAGAVAPLPASPALPESPRWRYAAPGIISIPHVAPPAATLRLLPFARWDSADATATHYRISAARLARASRQGASVGQCRQLLDQQAGPPPAGWCAALDAPAPAIRLVPTTVLLVDEPALLTHAARARSVQRYLDQRVAPGIALVRPDDCAPLLRALERQGIPCAVEPSPLPSRAAATLSDLSAGEHAALLLACAYYRQHAPADAPLLPHPALDARLRAGLSPALHAAVDAALAELRPPPTIVRRAEPPADAPVTGRAPLERTIQTLRTALAHQRPVELIYDTAGQGALSTRTVRPLALEQHDDTWYLRAYCSARQAERTFRVDRIIALDAAGGCVMGQA